MDSILFPDELTKRNWRVFQRAVLPVSAAGLLLLCLAGKTGIAGEAGLVFLAASFNFFLAARLTGLAGGFSAAWEQAALFIGLFLRFILAAVFLSAAFIGGWDRYLVCVVYLATHLLLSTITAADFCFGPTGPSRGDSIS